MLERYPFGRGGSASAVWAVARRSAAAAWAAGRGVRGSAGLQAADGDDLLSGPDLECEGAGAAAENGVGAVIQRMQRRRGAAAADPDQGGGEELGRQLAGQAGVGAGIVPGQRVNRSI